MVALNFLGQEKLNGISLFLWSSVLCMGFSMFLSLSHSETCRVTILTNADIKSIHLTNCSPYHNSLFVLTLRNSIFKSSALVNIHFFKIGMDILYSQINNLIKVLKFGEMFLKS